jgi:hypothetical protein
MHDLVRMHRSTIGVNRRTIRTGIRVRRASKKRLFVSNVVILNSLARWEGGAQELGVRTVVALEPLLGTVARGCDALFHVVLEMLAREELREDGFAAARCK